MSSAVSFCAQGGSIREASRKYNVPVTTLYCRTSGAVMLGCRPGPNPVLTVNAEERLVNYIVNMSEIGFGLSRQEVMCLAFQIAEKVESITHLGMVQQEESGLMHSDNDMHILHCAHHRNCHMQEQKL